MAEVYPFIGTRYNSQLIGNLSKVISPPYDSITEELQQELYDRHENNVVRLEASRDVTEDDEMLNRYTRAANTLGTWRSDGIFIEDERPSFYLYEQVYTDAAGEKRTRAGFFAKVKLEEKSVIDGDNLDALSGGRADRLDLLRAAKANTSAVTAVFDDTAHEVTELIRQRMSERPWEEITDETGTVHRLWVLQKKDLLLSVIEKMKDRKLFIADGHQRYTVAQAYRDEMRRDGARADGKQPFDFIMMLLLPLPQESVSVQPLHRALTKSIMADVDLKDALEELREHFEVEKDKADLTGGATEAQRLQEKLSEVADGGTAFALVHATGAVFYLRMKDDVELEDLYDFGEVPECVGALDVCILHNYVINQVLVGNPEYDLEDDECFYVPSVEEVLGLLKSKKAACAFLLNSIPLQRMLEIACNGALVPLDCSRIEPRPATGLVLRNMQTDVVKTARR